MKILGNITRLRGSNFRENIFLVQVDYEDYGTSYYGKSVKDTIYSFNQLTRASNFNDFKKEIVNQIPSYSFDLIHFRLKNFYKWIQKKF